MITEVTVAGLPLDPGWVLAEVTVLHGRRDVDDGPAASSATLTVEHPPASMPQWRGGDTVELAGPDGPVFTGRIADQALEHVRLSDGSTLGRFTVTAMGPVARLGVRTVGDEPWPAEAGTARAARVLTLAEVPGYLIDGAADAVILPRDVDSRPALDLLTEVATSTGAAVFDRPDGRVVYQPMSERTNGPYRWMDFDPALTWADFDPGMTWADFASWRSKEPVTIPATAVTWEPTWSTSASDVVNHVRVGYGIPAEGAEQPWQEALSQSSIDRHGRRYRYFGSQLRDQADALAYALWWVSVRSSDRWALEDITVHPDLLDGPTRAAVLGLLCGDHVRVDAMPQPAPAIVYTGIVEGWTYSQWGAGGSLFEQITLHTSAPLESLAAMAWRDFPAAYRWADFPPDVTWADVTDLEAIGA